MSLSKGSGPFGESRAGAGNYRIDSPKHILHFEPSPKRPEAERVRGLIAFYDERVDLTVEGRKVES